MKQIKGILKKRKGSSLITTLIVMIVLVLLGHAITILSLGTLRSNAADSSNNDAYYSAESAANSAVNYLKYEVVSYYQCMKEASPTQYASLLSNFATNIAYNAQTNFVEPFFDDNTTNTTFSVGTYDSANNICEFNIQCVSMTPDNSRYQVNASVYVKKIDISITGGALSVPDNAAIITGGLMDLDYNSAIGVIGGDVIVGGITYESIQKNKEPYQIVSGNLYVNPSIGDILHDPFVYPSYTDPIINDPDIYAVSDMTINTGNTPPSPVKITTAPGVKLSLSTNIDDGIIYGQGNVEIINGSYGADLYCDGNLYMNSCNFDGNIYVRGNFIAESSVLRGDLYCDGNVTWTSGHSEGNIISGGNVYVESASSVCNIVSKGYVTLSSVGVNAGLIYSSLGVSIGNCSVTALLYTTGDVVITGGMYLKGAIMGKGDFYFSNGGEHMQMNYAPEFIKQILDEVNQDIFSGGGTPPSLDSSIFILEKITPIGRVN